MERVIVKLRKSGNSVILTIPKPVLDELMGGDEGYLALSTKEGKRTFTSANILIVEKVLLDEELKELTE